MTSSRQRQALKGWCPIIITHKVYIDQVIKIWTVAKAWKGGVCKQYYLWVIPIHYLIIRFEHSTSLTRILSFIWMEVNSAEREQDSPSHNQITCNNCSKFTVNIQFTNSKPIEEFWTSLLPHFAYFCRRFAVLKSKWIWKIANCIMRLVSLYKQLETIFEAVFVLTWHKYLFFSQYLGDCRLHNASSTHELTYLKACHSTLICCQPIVGAMLNSLEFMGPTAPPGSAAYA